MKLTNNWVTEGLIDAEFKQYLLLAYLQNVESDFDELKIYPHLTDLNDRLNELNLIKKTKLNLFNHFDKEVTGIDLKQQKILYKNKETESEIFKTIDEIIEFSIPKINDMLNIGKGIFDRIWSDIKIVEMGIYNENRNYGYLILPNLFDMNVYQYELNILSYQNNDRILMTKLIKIYQNIFNINYKKIILDIKTESKQVNPPIFIVDSIIKYPLVESLLPISKRKLIRILSQP